jgi:hypothetical protein
MRVQSALHAALEPRLPADFSARSFARLLKLDKSLGWNVHRMTFATDPATVLSALPGKRGQRTLRDGLVAAGCTEESILSFDEALVNLLATIESRRISARELKAMASGGLDTDSQRRETLRRQRVAYEAVAALRGSSILERVAAYVIAPSATDGRVDLAALSIVGGIVKLRPCGPLPAYIPTRSVEPGAPTSLRGGPIGDHPSCPFLYRAASSPDLADSEILQAFATPPRTDSVFLADAAEHRKTPLILAFGETIRSAGTIRRTPGDSTATLVKPVIGPTARLTFDVLLHRGLPTVEPSAACYMQLTPREVQLEFAELARMPVALESGWVRSASIRGNPRVHEAYQTLLAHGCAAVGADLADFRVFRVTIDHPPAPSAVRIGWNLP